MANEPGQTYGILARCLGGIVGFGARHPRLALWSMVFLGCAAVGVTVNDLHLQTSRSELINTDDQWADFTEGFAGESDVVVVVKSDVPNGPMIEQALSQLGERLEREPEYFSNVLWRLNQGDLRRKALQLHSFQELRDAEWLAEYFEDSERAGRSPRLQVDHWAYFLASKVREGNERNNPSDSAIAYADRLTSSLTEFLQTKTAQGPLPAYSSPDLEITAQDRDVAHLMNRQGTAGFLRVSPVTATVDENSEAASPQDPVERLRYHLAEVQKSFAQDAPDLTLSLTGISVLETDELAHSRIDMAKAAAVAFVLVAVLLSLGLRGMRHPMLVLVNLVNSLAITFGIVTLAVGHLNIMSICFVAITIGLGVDFGIHFVTRYLHLRQELFELEESLVLTGRSVGMGIFTSAATTAIAFGSAVLTGYPGLAELGIITALGVLVCAFQTLTFLPALIALSDEPVEIDELPVPIDGKIWRSAVAGFPLTAIVLSVIGIIVVSYNAIEIHEDQTFSFKVGYNSDLMKMQDHSQDSVLAERKFARAKDSLLYAVALAESREEADELREKFNSLPTVDRVVDLAGKLPGPPSAEKSQQIKSLQAAAAGLRNASPTVQPPQLESAVRQLSSLQESLAESSDITAKQVSVRLGRLLRALDQQSMIDSYQQFFVQSLLNEFQQISTAGSLEPIQPQEIPVAWRRRYVRAEEDRELWLMKIYPKEDVWNQSALASFVGEIRTVSPDVTGVPVRNFETSASMWESYKTIGLFSLAAIGMFLLFDFLRPGQKLLTIIPPLMVVGFVGYTAHERGGQLNPTLLVGIYLGLVGFIATVFDFRNLRDTLIAMVPPVGGGLMLLGLMALLNVDFNPINLIVLPLVLGIGVDDGVHMVHDYRRQLASGSGSYTPSGDTVNGVLLTSLTSIVGFGSLMIASHRGLQSVGIVLAMGVASCLAVALILLPALLVLVAKHQPASLEPVPIRLRRPKAAAAEGEPAKKAAAQAQTQGAAAAATAGEEPRLSRKEKRRRAAA